MKKSLVLVLLTALYAVADPDARLDDLDTELEDGVEVSPECAVVIVTVHCRWLRCSCHDNTFGVVSECNWLCSHWS